MHSKLRGSGRDVSCSTSRRNSTRTATFRYDAPIFESSLENENACFGPWRRSQAALRQTNTVVYSSVAQSVCLIETQRPRFSRVPLAKTIVVGGSSNHCAPSNDVMFAALFHCASSTHYAHYCTPVHSLNKDNLLPHLSSGCVLALLL